MTVFKPEFVELLNKSYKPSTVQQYTATWGKILHSMGMETFNATEVMKNLPRLESAIAEFENPKNRIGHITAILGKAGYNATEIPALEVINKKFKGGYYAKPSEVEVKKSDE